MKTKIAKISTTNEKISARGGIPFILEYAERTKFLELIENQLLKSYYISKKRLVMMQFIKQIIGNFFDATDLSISGYSQVKQDEAHALLYGSLTQNMASSSQMKRYFQLLQTLSDSDIRFILRAILLWRLLLEKPNHINLGVDSCVFDNHYAQKREGSSCTYKLVNGYHPLFITYKGIVVDYLFRSGSTHSNHGDQYVEAVSDLVKFIRENYNPEIPIIVVSDSAFCDQDAFKRFELEHIHYITTGAQHADINEYTQLMPFIQWQVYAKDALVWHYTDLGHRMQSWDKMRRCIVSRLTHDKKGQYILDLHDSKRPIYTNIGSCPIADKRLIEALGKECMNAVSILKLSHLRGTDELVFKGLKELLTKENLPFQSFGENKVYLFFGILAFNLFECFKRDITHDVISITVMPNTFRRKFVYLAAKIVNHSRELVLKVSELAYKNLNLAILWQRCQSPPVIHLQAA